MALYKEIVKQHQNSIIIKITAIIILFIIISDLLIVLPMGASTYIYVKYIIYIGMVILFIQAIKRLKIKYKYAVIQDQLMVYRIIKKNEKLLRVVNLNDVIRIKKCNTFRQKLKWFVGTRYDFYRFNSNYKCFYKDNNEDKVKAFYFNPSINLLRILENGKCQIE